MPSELMQVDAWEYACQEMIACIAFLAAVVYIGWWVYDLATKE
jgi:hypothetical protein